MLTGKRQEASEVERLKFFSTRCNRGRFAHLVHNGCKNHGLKQHRRCARTQQSITRMPISQAT